jgi:hypothetical protein
MNNEAFEKILAEFKESDSYKSDSFLWSDMAKIFFQAGALAEREACVDIASGFEIAKCRSSYDDAVDQTAERIAEAIRER